MHLRSFMVYLAVGVGAVPALLNCSSSDDSASSSESAVNEDEGYVDCEKIAGVPGKLPKDDHLSAMQQIGRCTWVLSTGRTTSNPNFQVKGKTVPDGTGGTENLLRDIAKKNGTVVPVLETMSATSEQARTERWKYYGVMNDPGCTASTQEDEYGFRLDKCVDKYSAGAVGLRKFDNPKFDKNKWMALKAKGKETLMNAYRSDPNLEPPYLIGQTCGVCHTSFDPANPPADPAHPKWNNLKFTLGNQYFREGRFFASALPGGKTDFRWHVLEAQQPGTSDTSRIASDHIDNPNAINPIYSLLSRPWHTEALKKDQVTFDLTQDICPDLSTTCSADQKVPVAAALALLKPEQAPAAMAAIRKIVKQDGEKHQVQSILKGGEDSVGPVGALLRVYVNIGMCSGTWTKHFDPLDGNTKQSPLGISEIYSECAAYEQMLQRSPAQVLFLASQGPIYLKDAPGGAARINDALVDKGKVVFANNCAECHSSKQPPANVTDKKAWFRDQMDSDDWLTGNFLSDDLPHPVTEIGTNIARASHTNHMKGHIWNEAYASQTYDQRKWPGTVSLDNPYGAPIQYKGPDGGPGYYRTPTLISIWTRAPFMHNRSLGDLDAATNSMVVPGPSVNERVAAFESAAKMMLSPELRPKTKINGKQYSGYVKTTTSDSKLTAKKFGVELSFRVPAGTPIDLLANLDPTRGDVQLKVAALAAANIFGPLNPEGTLPSDLLNGGNTGTALMRLSEAPDLVENKGHTFGHDLSPDAKAAVIEYLKTL